MAVPMAGLSESPFYIFSILFLDRIWTSLNCYRRQDTCVTIVTTTLGTRTTYGCTSKDAVSWVKGNRHHATRHQRGSRCRNLADRIEHRSQSLLRGDNATQHTTEDDVVSSENQLEPKTSWWNLIAYKVGWTSCSSRMMGKIRRTMWMVAPRTTRLSMITPKIKLLVTTPKPSTKTMITTKRFKVHKMIKFVSKMVITGVVLEGPQCSHTVDYECLVAYNAQYLRTIRSRDLQ
eukprot:jgi/Phyca11/16584/fgenesh1_pg.PHYCAscaffold_21_\